MTPTKIKITLLSATTFGRGDGVAGLVDREIEHDQNGFPFLRGKTLKGLLAEAAENIVFALETLQGKSGWRAAKDELFGVGGSQVKTKGVLHIGDAQLPDALRAEVNAANWSQEDVLYSLTGIRRQTSINEHGAPDHASLRSMRVLLPGVVLEAPLTYDRALSDTEKQLLAAAVLDLRHAGTGRNRGRGWLLVELDDATATQKLFTDFKEAI